MKKTIIIDDIEYNLVPKQKSELDWIKEKYATGNYIMVRRNAPEFHEYTYNTKSCEKHGFKVIKNNWYIIEPEETYKYYPSFEHKLIHKKHKQVLDAYLLDNAVEIQYLHDALAGSENWCFTNGKFDGIKNPIYDFMESYNEYRDYRLKPQIQYPTFSRTIDGCVFKQISYADCQWVIHKNTSAIGNGFREYTKLDNYETIPYDKETGLYYLQPVWCWDDSVGMTNRTMGFYIEKNFVSFTNDNEIGQYDNIEPITYEQLKVMPFIWDMYQNILNICQ